MLSDTGGNQSPPVSANDRLLAAIGALADAPPPGRVDATDRRSSLIALLVEQREIVEAAAAMLPVLPNPGVEMVSDDVLSTNALIFTVARQLHATFPSILSTVLLQTWWAFHCLRCLCGSVLGAHGADTLAARLLCFSVRRIESWFDHATNPCGFRNAATPMGRPTSLRDAFPDVCVMQAIGSLLLAAVTSNAAAAAASSHASPPPITPSATDSDGASQDARRGLECASRAAERLEARPQGWIAARGSRLRVLCHLLLAEVCKRRGGGGELHAHPPSTGGAAGGSLEQYRAAAKIDEAAKWYCGQDLMPPPATTPAADIVRRRTQLSALLNLGAEFLSGVVLSISEFSHANYMRPHAGQVDESAPRCTSELLSTCPLRATIRYQEGETIPSRLTSAAAVPGARQHVSSEPPRRDDRLPVPILVTESTLLWDAVYNAHPALCWAALAHSEEAGPRGANCAVRVGELLRSGVPAWAQHRPTAPMSILLGHVGIKTSIDRPAGSGLTVDPDELTRRVSACLGLIENSAERPAQGSEALIPRTALRGAAASCRLPTSAPAAALSPPLLLLRHRHENAAGVQSAAVAADSAASRKVKRPHSAGTIRSRPLVSTLSSEGGALRGLSPAEMSFGGGPPQAATTTPHPSDTSVEFSALLTAVPPVVDEKKRRKMQAPTGGSRGGGGHAMTRADDSCVAAAAAALVLLAAAHIAHRRATSAGVAPPPSSRVLARSASATAPLRRSVSAHSFQPRFDAAPTPAPHIEEAPLPRPSSSSSQCRLSSDGSAPPLATFRRIRFLRQASAGMAVSSLRDPSAEECAGGGGETASAMSSADMSVPSKMLDKLVPRPPSQQGYRKSPGESVVGSGAVVGRAAKLRTHDGGEAETAALRRSAVDRAGNMSWGGLQMRSNVAPEADCVLTHLLSQGARR